MSGCHAPLIGNVVYSSDYIKTKIHSCSCSNGPKKPWKCPVCLGAGEWDQIKTVDGIKWLPCKSCEGTGIIWG